MTNLSEINILNEIDNFSNGGNNTGNIIDNNQYQNCNSNTNIINECNNIQENNASLAENYKSIIIQTSSCNTEITLINYGSSRQSNELYLYKIQNLEFSKIYDSIFFSLDIKNFDELFRGVENENIEYDININDIKINRRNYKESDLTNRKLETEYIFEYEINKNYFCKFVEIDSSVKGIEQYLQYKRNTSKILIEDKKIKFSLELTEDKQYNKFIFALALFTKENKRIINSYIIFSVKITENENEKE